MAAVLAKVFPKGNKGCGGQERKPVFIAFALHYFNAHVLTVYVSNFQPAAFLKAHPAAVKQLNDRLLLKGRWDAQQLAYFPGSHYIGQPGYFTGIQL